MKPATGEFRTICELQPGMPVHIGAVPGRPAYLQLGYLDVLRLDATRGRPMTARIVNPNPVNPVDAEHAYVNLMPGATQVIGRNLGRLGLGPNVSREHLSATFNPFGDSHYIVEDLGSMNGTRLVAPLNRVSTQQSSGYNNLGSAVPRLFERAASVPARKESGVFTIASDNHPARNEDASFMSNPDGIFAVFDGVGGSSGGGSASLLAAENIRDELAGRLRELARGADRRMYASVLKNLLREVDARLFQQGMGVRNLTTATVMVHTAQGEVVIANSGDSRSYVLRHGELLYLTQDNAQDTEFDGPLDDRETNVQRAIAEMDFTGERADRRVQAAFHNRNQITTCLGVGSPRISVTYFTPEVGDIILLSTDGVHDNLKDSEIAALLGRRSKESADQISSALVDSAHRKSRESHWGSHRPKPDDMTAVVVKY